MPSRWCRPTLLLRLVQRRGPRLSRLDRVFVPRAVLVPGLVGHRGEHALAKMRTQDQELALEGLDPLLAVVGRLRCHQVSCRCCTLKTAPSPRPRYFLSPLPPFEPRAILELCCKT